MPRATICLTLRVSPAAFHVLDTCGEDQEEPFSLAGRGSQEFPIVNTPLLASGTLQVRPFDVEVGGRSVTKLEQD